MPDVSEIKNLKTQEEENEEQAPSTELPVTPPSLAQRYLEITAKRTRIGSAQRIKSISASFKDRLALAAATAKKLGVLLTCRLILG